MDILQKSHAQLICALSLVILSFLGTKLYAQTVEDITRMEYKAQKMTSESLDSALSYYHSILAHYESTQDSAQMVNTLINIARIHASSGYYHLAYDRYWEALRIENDVNDSYMRSRIYIGLATLYSIFGRDNKAQEYSQKSLKLKKPLVASGQIEALELTRDYNTLANHNMSLGNYQLAQTYLDTSWAINRDQKNKEEYPYLDVIQGRIYYLQHKIEKAKTSLLNAANNLPQPETPYYTIVYYYLGDVYYALKQLDIAETYYLKSIQLSDNYQSFQNNVTKVYPRLAELYAQQGKPALAYHYQKEGSALIKKLFDARSHDKTSMLEIKDNYRITLEKKNQLLEQAHLSELEQQQEILFLRNIILSVSVLTLLIVAILILIYQKKKHKAERKFHQNKQMISQEKNKEILDLKNKELTSSALQLIEKDALLLEIKEELINFKESGKKQTLDQALNKIRINSKHDWKEFDARFTSVNQDFYDKLASIYPELTRRDHKLCALIKLSFSSKEIAQLLGISMESVNTSRYRLRKKMKLDKADNLVDIIGRL